jgi:hypothetical protein
VPIIKLPCVDSEDSTGMEGVALGKVSKVGLSNLRGIVTKLLLTIVG